MTQPGDRQAPAIDVFLADDNLIVREGVAAGPAAVAARIRPAATLRAE